MRTFRNGSGGTQSGQANCRQIDSILAQTGAGQRFVAVGGVDYGTATAAMCLIPMVHTFLDNVFSAGEPTATRR